MVENNWFKKMLDSMEDDFDFRLESKILEITETICERMKKKDISRTRLSELLSISKPGVTKILNGSSNFTLKTLLSISDALDLELNVQFREKQPIADAASCESVEMVTDSLSTNVVYVAQEEHFKQTQIPGQELYGTFGDADFGKVAVGGGAWG